MRIGIGFSSFAHFEHSTFRSRSCSYGSNDALHLHDRPVARLLLVHSQTRIFLQRRPLRAHVVFHRQPRGVFLLLVALRRSGVEANHIRSPGGEARIFSGREGWQSCHGMHQAV